MLFLDHGRILEQGPPGEILRRPQNPRAQDFLQRILHKELFAEAKVTA